MASNKTVDNRFRELLQEFEEHLRDEADLGQLKVIRRQIRETLPFSVRAYLPAYLLQEAVGSGIPLTASGRKRSASGKKSPGGPSSRNKRPSDGEKRARNMKTAERGRDLPASRADNKTSPMNGETVRLFVNIGRRRKISREALTDLFVTKLGMKSEEIFSVRILENYSFIELPVAQGKSAIEGISGETLNGRILTVDYARTRKPKP